VNKYILIIVHKQMNKSFGDYWNRPLSKSSYFISL